LIYVHSLLCFLDFWILFRCASGRQGRSLVDPPEFLLLLSPVADEGHTRSFKYREVQILGRNLHFQER